MTPTAATPSARTACLLTGILATTLVLSACTRSVEPLTTVQPLPPAPTGNVSSQPLGAPNQPGTPGAIDPSTGLPFPADGTQIATTEPVAEPTVAAPTSVSSEPLQRGSVSGVWDVQVAGGTCRMVTSFTRSSTHFRAAPLRCPDSELTNVKEWNVSGNQMVLYDGSGNPVARVFKTGAQRLDGKTTSGTAVTLSRDS